MGARVPASQLDPLSELEEAPERRAKAARPAKAAQPERSPRVPVRAGSLVALPRALRAVPFFLFALLVVGAVIDALSAPRLATSLFIAAAGVFVSALGALTIRLVKLEELRRRARPTTDLPDPHHTIDVGVGREIFQLEAPPPPPGHPYRARATAERHFLVGDIAAARSVLLGAIGRYVVAGAVGCIPFFFVSRAPAARDEPRLPRMDDLAIANAEGQQDLGDLRRRRRVHRVG
jgi:hypothetical protein